jgi:VWFA-related protein
MTRSIARAGTAAALIILLLGGTFASSLQNPQTPPAPQNPPPPQNPPAQRPPVFRAGANFVLVDAYPQRDGKLVEGLTAADFEVREDGQPQKVEMFEFVRVEPSLSESTRRDPNNQREMEALASDPHNRIFVVYLDTLHTTVDGSHNIRGPLVDALNRIIGPDDLFGVMTPNLDPRLITFGRRLLTVEEQLSRHWAWGERNRITPDRQDPVEQNIHNCFPCKPTPDGRCIDWLVEDGARLRKIDDVLIDRRREDRTLTSIEGLIDHLARLREARTAVLAITDGWLLYRENRALAEEAGVIKAAAPGIGVTSRGTIGVANIRDNDPNSCNSELIRLAQLDNERRFRDMLRSANRANVSFYPINPGGLGTFDSPISEQPIANPRVPSGVLADDMRRVTERVSNLRTLAENTDGIAIVNTNDLRSGLQRIVDDVSAYYLLGYYSTNSKFDGKVRTIQVRMKQPNLTVRARRSYLAPSEAQLRAEAAAAATPNATAASAAVTEALDVLSRLRPTSELFIHGAQDDAGASVAVEMASAKAVTSPWKGGGDVEVTLTNSAGATIGTGQGHIDAGWRATLIRVPFTVPSSGPLRVTARLRAGNETVEDRGEIRAVSTRVIGDPLLSRGSTAATSPLRAVADFQYRRTERAHVEWPILVPLDRREARLLGRNGQPLAVPVNLTERQTNGRNMLAADVTLAPLTEGDYVIDVTAGSGADVEQRRVAIRVIR